MAATIHGSSELVRCMNVPKTSTPTAQQTKYTLDVRTPRIISRAITRHTNPYITKINMAITATMPSIESSTATDASHDDTGSVQPSRRESGRQSSDATETPRCSVPMTPKTGAARLSTTAHAFKLVTSEKRLIRWPRCLIASPDRGVKPSRASSTCCCRSSRFSASNSR